MTCVPSLGYGGFQWGGVVSTTAYIGWRVVEAGHKKLSPIVVSLMGAATMPTYEGLCTKAGWFSFTDKMTTFDVPVIGGHSAYADVVGNLIFYAILALLVNHVWEARDAETETPPWRHAVLVGISLAWFICNCSGRMW